MKKNIIIITAFVCIVLVAMACASSKKCPAYGYHTQNVEQPVESEQI